MGGGPAWKREDVPDHKFDFVDTREFTDNGFAMRMKYLFLYLVVLKSFLVYVSDIFTATTMLTTSGWSNDIYNSCPKSDPQGCIPVDFNIGKWVFFGCIIFSFLLLAYEARKSRKVIQSRDISYAFTNIMANNYYSLRSYDHFCFFDHISNSTKKKDDFAFFVFFTFKSWKRLLLADGPRQAINAITLYSFYLSKENAGPWYDIQKYYEGRQLVANLMTCTIVFTVLVFAGSMVLLIVAGICYIPLLCYVQGNLKEYVCHKVDKRIAEIIRRRNKQRQLKAAALARKEAAGDFSHLKNKKGAMTQPPLPQPTLPNVTIDDDDGMDTASQRTRVGPGGAKGDGYNYGVDNKYSAAEYAREYPPMPAYMPNGGPTVPGAYPFQGYGATNPAYPEQQQDPSMAIVYEVPAHYYEDDYGQSNVALVPPVAGAQAPVEGYEEPPYAQQDRYQAQDERTLHNDGGDGHEREHGAANVHDDDGLAYLDAREHLSPSEYAPSPSEYYLSPSEYYASPNDERAHQLQRMSAGERWQTDAPLYPPQSQLSPQYNSQYAEHGGGGGGYDARGRYDAPSGRAL